MLFTNVLLCAIIIFVARQVLLSGTWGISAVGSAFEWHSKGQGFDSPMLHQNSSTFRLKSFLYIAQLKKLN